MNVIVANKYQSMLQSLNIDIIKTMYGEFDVDEIIKTFKNFFFQRMILDITAIKDYKDISKLQKLSVELDMSKVILFFDDTADTAIPNFYSMLVAMGIYNFTKSFRKCLERFWCFICIVFYYCNITHWIFFRYKIVSVFYFNSKNFS